MPGNSQRKGAIKKAGKGNPTAGSGGAGEARARGQGPDAEGQGPAVPQGPQEEGQRRQGRWQPPASPEGKGGGDHEWIAGRNSVVEALRAELPVTAVYVAEGAERDGRLKEVFAIAADRGLSLLEVPRVELDRMTAGAVHQGLAARVPAYEYAHPMTSSTRRRPTPSSR